MNSTKPKTLDEWKERVHWMNPHMEILNKTVPVKDEKFILHCNKCGVTIERNKSTVKASYLQRKNGHINKEVHWCPCCNSHECYPGYNDIATMHPDLLKYFVDKNDAKTNTYKVHKKVDMKCPNCGAIRKYNICTLSTYGFSCHECSDNISFPNKICREFVKQLPVDYYEFEYSDDWTCGRQYDAFFIYNSIKYLLEFDGGQHYFNSFGKNVDDQIKIDKLKDSLAKDNGYILIRINCSCYSFDYIKNNIIDSQLSDIFNLSIINWDSCHKNSLKNIIYEVGYYYNEHADQSPQIIAKHFQIGGNTAIRYLKKASSIGICDYSPTVATMNRTKKEYIPLMDKSFYAYDMNEKYIGKFNFRSECAEYINANYTIQIATASIGKALLSGKKCKGFSFSFVNGLGNYYDNNTIFYNTCEQYNKLHINPKELSKIMNISIGKIIQYLNAGTSLGLCEYNI